MKGFSFSPGKFTPSIEVTVREDDDDLTVGESVLVPVDELVTRPGDNGPIVTSIKPLDNECELPHVSWTSGLPACDELSGARICTDVINTDFSFHDLYSCPCLLASARVMECSYLPSVRIRRDSHSCDKCAVCLWFKANPFPRLWVDCPGSEPRPLWRYGQKKFFRPEGDAWYLVPIKQRSRKKSALAAFANFDDTCFSDRPPDLAPRTTFIPSFCARRRQHSNQAACTAVFPASKLTAPA